ncbi:MAG: DUF1850 domain-containing protein [Desulfurococcales archaeon]|nr:DUF1850 domain-containing protein [Desulfurococcales archaeon]MCE4605218.1 DUF1850 domain-containing protein [Desulfurococcales archaeon]
MKNPSPSDHARATILLAILLLTVLGVSLAPARGGAPAILLVRCDDSVYLIPSPRGTFIVVEFTHSVHKTPEMDVVSPGPIMRIRAIAFQEYGAGVPEGPQAIGGSLEDTSGDFIVYQGGGGALAESIRYNLENVIDPDISIAGIPVSSGDCGSIEVRVMTGAR